MVFFYHDGAEVMVGDHVAILELRRGHITQIFESNSDLAAQCENLQGGVIIAEYSPNGEVGHLVIGYRDGSDWDDLTLLARREAPPSAP